MILVTGGTGFIGQVLIRQLVAAGFSVRLLIRPSRQTPRLPHGVAVEVALTSLQDERGLRAAMIGVDTVFHLAGGEKRGAYASLLEDDILGTQNVVKAALDAGVRRLFYLSHLGAERASAYPVFKAKAIAEESIKRSGIDYTILRSSVVYGEGDGFTTRFARLVKRTPWIFLLPGDGSNKIQPLWVEDLAACLMWAIQDEGLRNRTIEVGGGEYLSFRDFISAICQVTGVRRMFIPIPLPALRALTVFMESSFPNFPLSVFWLDYLSYHRTCTVDTLPRTFNIIPAPFYQTIDYLRKRETRDESKTRKAFPAARSFSALAERISRTRADFFQTK